MVGERGFERPTHGPEKGLVRRAECFQSTVVLRPSRSCSTVPFWEHL
jgi:hypothetical protein